MFHWRSLVTSILFFLFFAVAIIVLYPADSLIFKEGWKGEEMFVLVRGQ